MFITFSLMILWGFQLKSKPFRYCIVFVWATNIERLYIKMLLLAFSGTISESHFKDLKCLVNACRSAGLVHHSDIFVTPTTISVATSIYISHVQTEVSLEWVRVLWCLFRATYTKGNLGCWCQSGCVDHQKQDKGKIGCSGLHKS